MAKLGLLIKQLFDALMAPGSESSWDDYKRARQLALVEIRPVTEEE